jgi:hypothetical protein
MGRSRGLHGTHDDDTAWFGHRYGPSATLNLVQIDAVFILFFISMLFTMYRILVEEVWMLIIAPTGPRGDVWLSEATLRILHWQVSTCVYLTTQLYGRGLSNNLCNRCCYYQ